MVGSGNKSPGNTLWFIAPIGWKYALLVWGYAFAWFVINDFVKIWAYKLLRRKEIIA